MNAPSCSGVYFARSGDDGPIKIGKSRCIAKRIAEMALMSGHPLRFLAAIPGDGSEERVLHRRFKALRLHGEWFTPSAEMLDVITEAAARTPPTGSTGRERKADGARQLTASAAVSPDGARITILAALSKADGNISAAAEALDVGRQTLQRLLDRLDLRAEVAERWPRADR